MDSCRGKAFLDDVSGWLRDGQFNYKEDVVEGLDKAAQAFIGQLQGENFGKLIVKVSPDPTQGLQPSRR